MNLPLPRDKGDLSLEELLMTRNSIREFLDVPITLSQLSQILWASCGRGRNGRTIPSAGARYPIRVYAVAMRVDDLVSGVYRYEPHTLVWVRDIIDGFGYYAALAYVVIAVDYSVSVARYGKRGYLYSQMEVGHAAQNVTLQALALGLGSVVVGGFRHGRVKQQLNLSDDPLSIVCIGTGISHQ